MGRPRAIVSSTPPSRTMEWQVTGLPLAALVTAANSLLTVAKDKPCHTLGCVIVQPRCHVAVDVEGYADVRVPKTLLYDLRVYEPPWVRWRLGLLDSDQVMVGAAAKLATLVVSAGKRARTNIRCVGAASSRAARQPITPAQQRRVLPAALAQPSTPGRSGEPRFQAAR